MSALAQAGAAPVNVWLWAATIVVGLLSTAAGIIAGVVGWSLKSAMGRNADDHRKTDERIDRLTEAIAAEREARHETFKTLHDDLHEIDGRVRDDYTKKVETMKVYGTLFRAMAGQHRETIDRIDKLPCHRLACPPGGPPDA